MRVLIHRLGSIGDFVVSLPCLHLVRRRYPDAEIALLTNQPVAARAAAARTILDGSGLIDRYITYPVQVRNPRVLGTVWRAVRDFRPELLVYLVERHGVFDLWRDYFFFHSCGIPTQVGFPFDRDLRECRLHSARPPFWESHAERLARCVAALGDAEPDRAASWDLRLTAAERAEADRRLPSTGDRCIALSIGTKQAVKDWGQANWRAVLDALNSSDLGLVLIGADDEREISAAVASAWRGPLYNVCGEVSPRVSAAVLAKTRFLLCHDSGPMHLAAAVGTPCVAVFSTKNRRGEWYPFGPGHRVLYPPSGASSIQAIPPAAVVAAARTLLATAYAA
ncbi:MAG: glycosyltransferase family 9 protein [Gemmatimonas sp.]